MDTKIIGLLLLICAGLIFQYSYQDFAEDFFSPNVKLKKVIEGDISKSLQEQTQKSISNLHHLEVKYRSPTAEEFLKKHPFNFQTNKEGTVWMEVEVLDLQDEENPGFITQTSVFDLKTKNKISEFGQTYYFKDFDKNMKVKTVSKAPENPANSPNKKSKKEPSKTQSKE